MYIPRNFHKKANFISRGKDMISSEWFENTRTLVIYNKIPFIIKTHFGIYCTKVVTKITNTEFSRVYILYFALLANVLWLKLWLNININKNIKRRLRKHQ